MVEMEKEGIKAKELRLINKAALSFLGTLVASIPLTIKIQSLCSSHTSGEIILEAVGLYILVQINKCV